MIALDLDHAVLYRAPDTAALLQFPRELLQPRVIDRHARDCGHGLAAAARNLAPDLDAITICSPFPQATVGRLAQVAIDR